jgi:ADP-ribose pyrophosphatase
VDLYCGIIDSRDLIVDGHGQVDEGEDIRLQILPTDAAIGLLDHGGVVAAMPIIALQWLALNRADLQTRWQDAPRAPYNGPASALF